MLYSVVNISLEKYNSNFVFVICSVRYAVIYNVNRRYPRVLEVKMFSFLFFLSVQWKCKRYSLDAILTELRLYNLEDYKCYISILLKLYVP